MSIAFQPAHFNNKVTLLNDVKLTLTGEPIEGNQPGRLPKLQLDLRDNYPEFVVRLNNGKQKEEGFFRLNIDLPTFMTIMVALEDACKSDKECCCLFAVKRQAFDPATRKPKEPYIYAVIAVGKNSDGCEFIGIQRGNPGSKNHVKVNFFFTTPEFHPILDRATMQPAPRNVVSNLVARGWVNVMKSLLPTINAHTWQYDLTAEAKRLNKQQQNGNQGGYGNNANNQGYSNYSQQSSQSSGYNAPAPQQTPQQSTPSQSGGDAGFNDGEDFPW